MSEKPMMSCGEFVYLAVTGVCVITIILLVFPDEVTPLRIWYLSGAWILGAGWARARR